MLRRALLDVSMQSGQQNETIWSPWRIRANHFPLKIAFSQTAQFISDNRIHGTNPFCALASALLPLRSVPWRGQSRRPNFSPAGILFFRLPIGIAD